MKPVTLMIGADVAPTSGSEAAFLSGSMDNLLHGQLQTLWKNADFRVFNLESPLTDQQTPIEKCGPALSAPTACVAGLSALLPSAIALSNNHIFDHGPEGLKATTDTLQSAGIPFFGAAENAAEADKPILLDKDGVKVCIYAVCEHEFSSAGPDSPGANPLNELELGDRVRQWKAECDYLVVLYHGGREYYPYPSPNLQRRCRKMAEWGADAVICQHSHCVGSFEKYDGSVIVYGQGNFLFDMDDEPCFDRGLIVRLTLEDGGAEVEFIPIMRKDHGAALARGEQAEEILGGLCIRSEEIARPGFVEETFHAYALSQREKMLKVFLSGNPFLRLINLFYGRKPSRVYSRAAQLAMKNSLQCEALNELITRGM